MIGNRGVRMRLAPSAGVVMENGVNCEREPRKERDHKQTSLPDATTAIQKPGKFVFNWVRHFEPRKDIFPQPSIRRGLFSATSFGRAPDFPIVKGAS